MVIIPASVEKEIRHSSMAIHLYQPIAFALGGGAEPEDSGVYNGLLAVSY